jgi:hypothetical protein
MPLACGCDDYDGGDADYYYESLEFVPLATKNRRRCKSCKKVLEHGETVLKIARYRYWITEIEEKIYGDGEAIPIADWYHCERCGGIFLSLQELGFCMDPNDKMDTVLSEYHRDYAKPPAPDFTLKIKERV